MNVIQKPLSGLMNVLQKPHKAFQGFGSGFTELHTKLCADKLLNFAIHRRRYNKIPGTFQYNLISEEFHIFKLAIFECMFLQNSGTHLPNYDAIILKKQDL
jgi:hypothetical protein